MKNQLTEFSFAYAFTEEFIRFMEFDLDFAPFIPNLKEEGKLAYDLKISWGLPVFVQFKLPKFIKVLSSRVYEYSTGCFSSPFYRFDLRTVKSDQHNLLCELSNSGQLVYYVSPIFWEVKEFNNYYLNRQIIDNSFLVEPREIGKYTDGKSHCISYRSTSNFYSLSEPVYHEGKFNIKSLSEKISDSASEAQKDKQDGNRFWERIEENLLNLIQEYNHIKKEHIVYNRDANVIDRISFLGRGYLGSEIFVISGKNKQN